MNRSSNLGSPLPSCFHTMISELGLTSFLPPVPQKGHSHTTCHTDLFSLYNFRMKRDPPYLCINGHSKHWGLAKNIIRWKWVLLSIFIDHTLVLKKPMYKSCLRPNNNNNNWDHYMTCRPLAACKNKDWFTILLQTHTRFFGLFYMILF